ncbi:Galactosylgalactosylxylosylprotein 3-beta-glucuronosyltransferase I [Pseudolycoriella hygida]|uniref:Galactosylgalactosylxylosylprotein 3-beta-glucuronosyltransferase n=1 Tax=Pseudolycoriella hygida TaxID=35572 RepID=A0A9Q0MRC0_9DIPT|nr:Galactosylgalactosylxylosylprotein 3-beta-glucuronosyltransferase I [Pseudolycoriella hygida]
MNEIRLKPKNFLITVGAITFLLIWLLFHNRCANSDEQPNSDLPIIYAITPTYARPVQKAELTRLSHVVKLVPNIHWIIIEDAIETSKLVKSLLERADLKSRSTLLSAKTPDDFKLKAKDPNWSKARGVEQRNAGLEVIRKRINKASSRHTIVYFMDDDNTYSLELFQEMAKIERGKVGVWPVGLVGGLMVEKPILGGNEIIGFNSAWRPERPFPIDMAGFAISGDLIMDYPDASFSYEAPRGYQESEILRYVTVVRDLQPLANNCRSVLVWHTRTEAPKLDSETKLKKDGQKRSDDGMEV